MVIVLASVLVTVVAPVPANLSASVDVGFAANKLKLAPPETVDAFVE
jgi:hypothetical protein